MTFNRNLASWASCIAGLAALVPIAALAQFKISAGDNELVLSGALNAQIDYLATSGTTNSAAQPPNRSRLNQNGSELRFSGTRNFRPELQAFFTIGSEIQSFSGGNANNTNTFALRNTGVGLRGKYGEAALGRWDSHYHFGPILVDQSYLTGPTAWSANSIIAFVGTSELIGNRFANTVRYNTPTWSGFTLHAIGSRGDGAVNNAAATGISNARDTSANVALTYRDAGLTGFISAYERRDFIMNLPYSAVATASLTSQRSVRAGIKHSWSNGLSVGALVDRSREGHEVPGGPAAFSGVRGVSRTAWALPVEYALGPHRISATYAKAGSAAGTLLPNSITATNAGSGADLKYVGYKYWLDQNTNLHAGWAQVSNKPNGAYDLYLNGGVGTDLRGNATARGTDVQTFQLGLFYRF